MNCKSLLDWVQHEVLMFIWAATWENVFWHVRPMKTQIGLRFRAVWSLPAWKNNKQKNKTKQKKTNKQKKHLHPWLSTLRPVKIPISLCRCAGWSASSLGAHVHMYVSWRFSSYNYGECWFSDGVPWTCWWWISLMKRPRKDYVKLIHRLYCIFMH